MPVLSDISTLYTCLDSGGQGNLHPIRDAAVAWADGEIVWVGPEIDLPHMLSAEERFSAGGKMVVPGLVDCHTHLAFGGWRADEFEKRLGGASYLDIARAGGGILRTMRQTREAGIDQLLELSLSRLTGMLQLGVTTVECKSGYGLSKEAELKQLRVHTELEQQAPQQIVSTFLGAHTVPPEYRGNRDDYVDLLCEDMIPEIADAGLAAFCDVFVEETAFSSSEARKILQAGQVHGLRAKLHVDQLGDSGGAALAVDVGAVSADHLEYTGTDGIRHLAQSSTVAVCLPIATLYLKQRPMAAREFVDAGIAVAVATDFNPGSAPSFHLPFAMMLSCTMNGLTPAEALKGATMMAARALRLESVCGSVEVGKRADLAIIDAPDVNHWMYHFKPNACAGTVAGGQVFA